ncbi:MAG: DUF1801 domain-containing protein [Myxococcaceae bacterium]
MAKRDPKVDAYIAKKPEFAQQILKALRAQVHAAVPGLEETIKWNSPFFLLKGRMFVSMAAFKAHCKLLVWRTDFRSGWDAQMDFKSVDELPTKAALAKILKKSAKSYSLAP